VLVDGSPAGPSVIVLVAASIFVIYMLRRRREYEKVTLSMVWDSDLLEKAHSRRDPWHRIHFRTARLDLRRQPVGNEGCPRRLLVRLSGRSGVSGEGEEPMGKRESYEPGTFCWVDLTTTGAKV
jgi:hypothetical protein